MCPDHIPTRWDFVDFSASVSGSLFGASCEYLRPCRGAFLFLIPEPPPPRVLGTSAAAHVTMK